MSIENANISVDTTAGIEARKQADRKTRRALEMLEIADSFLDEVRFQVQPHLLNTWSQIVCNKDKGLIAVSKKYTKAMRLAEPTRQQIADSCFKSALNFQKRTREASIAKDTINIESSSVKSFNNKMLCLLEGILPEDEIENSLIEMLRLHRSRKLMSVSQNLGNGSSRPKSNKRIRTDVMTPLASKRSNDRNNGSQREILIYNRDAYEKAEQIRNEMMAEIILKWGLWDYKHMIAARRIEAKHMRRMVAPKLSFEKFTGGRFFSVTLERKYVPKLKDEMREMPDYKIMPIIARELKHIKGHFSFSSIERDIKGKGPGDNWTVRPYTPLPSQFKSNKSGGSHIERRYENKRIQSERDV